LSAEFNPVFRGIESSRQFSASAYIYVSARVPQRRKLINRNVTMTSPALTRSAGGKRVISVMAGSPPKPGWQKTNGTAGEWMSLSGN